MRVVLGSASPARRRVLIDAGVNPIVRVSDVDEDAVAATVDPSSGPRAVVTALAEAKARVVADRVAAEDPEVAGDCVVVGCDSMLFHDGELTGKPHTAAAATAQWHRLRGRSAELLTGHSVLRMADGVVVGAESASTSTTVRFADIDDATVTAYVATGEPLEVAGAFTLDGLGGWFVDGIDGDHSAVIGIGLSVVRTLFARLGVTVADVWESAAPSVDA
ncbi:MAG: Maf family protein [Gordonia paraffinivorans]